MEPDLLVPGIPADHPVEVFGKGVFYNDQRGPYAPESPVEDDFQEAEGESEDESPDTDPNKGDSE